MTVNGMHNARENRLLNLGYFEILSGYWLLGFDGIGRPHAERQIYDTDKLVRNRSTLYLSPISLFTCVVTELLT